MQHVESIAADGYEQPILSHQVQCVGRCLSPIGHRAPQSQEIRGAAAHLQGKGTINTPPGGVPGGLRRLKCRRESLPRSASRVPYPVPAPRPFPRSIRIPCIPHSALLHEYIGYSYVIVTRTNTCCPRSRETCPPVSQSSEPTRGRTSSSRRSSGRAAPRRSGDPDRRAWYFFTI